MDKGGNIDSFINGRGKRKGRLPNERYSSFDYCFNYFRSFYESDRVNELASKDNIQVSCLQLGFYLASWGMYRASAFLSKKSAKALESVIVEISNSDFSIWEVDANNYTDDKLSNININDLNDIEKSIRNKIIYHNNRVDIFKNILNNINTNIMNRCDHNYERDMYDMYREYPIYYCTKCGKMK